MTIRLPLLAVALVLAAGCGPSTTNDAAPGAERLIGLLHVGAGDVFAFETLDEHVAAADAVVAATIVDVRPAPAATAGPLDDAPDVAMIHLELRVDEVLAGSGPALTAGSVLRVEHPLPPLSSIEEVRASIGNGIGGVHFLFAAARFVPGAPPDEYVHVNSGSMVLEANGLAVAPNEDVADDGQSIDELVAEIRTAATG